MALSRSASISSFRSQSGAKRTRQASKYASVGQRGIGWDVERSVVADFGKSTKGEEAGNGGNGGNPSGIPGEEGGNLVDCNSCRLPPKMSAKSNRLPPLPPVHG